jgi:Fe-S cluster assembly protein SufD
MNERVETITARATTTAWDEAFAQNPHSVHLPAVVQRFQQEQLAAFLLRGLPSRREEAWKYTDLSCLEKTFFTWPHNRKEETLALQQLVAARAQDTILLVFINGYFAPHLSTQASVPEGIIIHSLQQAVQAQLPLFQKHWLREPDVKRHPFVCLNNALLGDGLFLYLPSKASVEKPVHILSVATENTPFMMQPRHMVVMESDTHLTLTEEYVALTEAAYFTNTVVDLFMGQGAQLNYYKVQQEANKATHLATIVAHQQQHSALNAGFFSFGGQFARNDIVVHLQEQQATCCLKGFYGLSQAGQFSDYHLYVDHAAPYTKSDMDFRGVIAKQARAVFNGRVLVRAAAKKTRAQQYNHNILLSPLAEINTKPDLEVYAEDIESCRHGATVGQLDEEALFYLATRGIGRSAAIVLLLQAFMEAVLGSITLPALAVAMQQQWQAQLVTLL